MENSNERLLTPELIERLKEATAQKSVSKVLRCHGLYNRSDRNVVWDCANDEVWRKIEEDGYLAMVVSLGDCDLMLTPRRLAKLPASYGVPDREWKLLPGTVELSEDGTRLTVGGETYSASTPKRHRLFKRLYDELLEDSLSEKGPVESNARLLTPEMIKRLKEATADHDLGAVLSCHGIDDDISDDDQTYSLDAGDDDFAPVWLLAEEDGYLAMAVNLGDDDLLLTPRHLLLVQINGLSYIWKLEPGLVSVSDDGTELIVDGDVYTESSPKRHLLFKKLYDELLEDSLSAAPASSQQESPQEDSADGQTNQDCLCRMLGKTVRCLRLRHGEEPVITAGVLEGLLASPSGGLDLQIRSSITDRVRRIPADGSLLPTSDQELKDDFRRYLRPALDGLSVFVLNASVSELRRIARGLAIAEGAPEPEDERVPEARSARRILTDDMIERLREVTDKEDVHRVLGCYGLDNDGVDDDEAGYGVAVHSMTDDSDFDSAWRLIHRDGYLVMSVSIGDSGDLLLTPGHLLVVGYDGLEDTWDLKPGLVDVSEDGKELTLNDKTYKESSPRRHRLFKQLYDELLEMQAGQA